MSPSASDGVGDVRHFDGLVQWGACFRSAF